jgi:hypothetical protein
MGELGIDGKLVADLCGHGLDVSQNVYHQSPAASGLPAVSQLEISIDGVQNSGGRFNRLLSRCKGNYILNKSTYIAYS